MICDQFGVFSECLHVHEIWKRHVPSFYIDFDTDVEVISIVNSHSSNHLHNV